MMDTSIYIPFITGTHEILDPLAVSNGRSIAVTNYDAQGYQFELAGLFGSMDRVEMTRDGITSSYPLVSPSKTSTQHSLCDWLPPSPLPSTKYRKCREMRTSDRRKYLWLLSLDCVWSLHSELMTQVAACVRHSERLIRMDINDASSYELDTKLFDCTLISVAALCQLGEL
jgi:hypothetical protein